MRTGAGILKPRPIPQLRLQYFGEFPSTDLAQCGMDKRGTM